MSDDDAVARSDALLGAIYQSAVEPAAWLALRQHLLKNFRHDQPTTEHQRSFLAVVLDHLQRALRIAERRARLEWERRQVGDFIDAVAPAICVIRDDYTIVGLNQAARRTLESGVGQALFDATVAPEQRAGLEHACAAAAREGHGSTSVPAAPSGELLIHVAPLATGPEVLYSVVVFNQDATLAQAIAHYAEFFRLTAKERRLVERAIRCRRLDHAAEAEHISYHTARQHLKAVYEKTGASNQAELIAGVLRQVIVHEAGRTKNTALIPHIRGLAQTRFVRTGGAEGPRQLCYAEYGDPDGTPVLYFHSLFGSRLELFVQNDVLRSNGVRLIAVDRPGYGHSDFYEYASYDAHTRDIRHLLDTLGLDEVGILACSAGTPHALACAAALGPRVIQVHCTGSLVPMEHLAESASLTLLQKINTNLFRIAPSLVRPAVELMFRGQTVESLYRALLSGNDVFRANARDAEFISQRDHFDHFVAFTIEALRQGPRAMGKEVAMITQDWGVDLRPVTRPVYFWHGAEDELVPVEVVSSFARKLPGSRVFSLGEETHWMIFRHLERILPAFRTGAAA